MVECAALKPCWCVGRIILVVMCGRMIFSRIFAMGESRAIGLYEEGREGFLLGLVMGMILEVFHIWGMVFVLIVML